LEFDQVERLFDRGRRGAREHQQGGRCGGEECCAQSHCPAPGAVTHLCPRQSPDSYLLPVSGSSPSPGSSTARSPDQVPLSWDLRWNVALPWNGACGSIVAPWRAPVGSGEKSETLR